MSNRRTRSHVLGLPAAALVLAGWLALSPATVEAQTTAPQTPQTLPAPTPGDPKSTVPEKIEPPPAEAEKTPRSANETLSDKLERGQGVIRPPDGITPDMRVPAPVPEPNTTPVIPPPGTPGNPAPVVPK